MPELRTHLEEIKASYESFKLRRLKLDLTRGKPAPAQLDLSLDILSLPGPGTFRSIDGTDCRNYGGLQGLPEARHLFSKILGAPADQVVVGNNSSLALMHEIIVQALLKGNCDGPEPWSSSGPVSFLCPVPGYDRHFKICEDYGIRMISVAINEEGPDMDQVERLAGEDESIKGMWCVPKYSNPTGTIYSDNVVDRLARMKAAAPDFRLFWDNAYAVHHLTEERIEIANILGLCKRHGHENRPFVFSSTSKITMAGAGMALFAASKDNVKWFLSRAATRSIGPDKLNQLRHVHFLKDHSGILALMDRHRKLIRPKFEKVLDIFHAMLNGLPGVSWTKPKGGYFISLEVPPGCAKHVVNLATEAGLALTPAGATHPYGHDPEDRTIRIAPTFPDIEEVAQAAEGVALCVRLAAAGTTHK